MLASKDPILHLQLVIVEELLEKARFRVLIELGTDEATGAIASTSLTTGVDLDLFLRCLVHSWIPIVVLVILIGSVLKPRFLSRADLGRLQVGEIVSLLF